MAFTLALEEISTGSAGEPRRRSQALRVAMVNAVAQQLDSAIANIEQTREETASEKEAAIAVHEARKSLKRIRATLRLLRSAMGDKAFRAESQRFAGVGRMLSDTREAQVMDQVLRELARLCNADAESTDAASDKGASDTGDGGGAALTGELPLGQAAPWPDAVRAGYVEAVAMARQARRERPKPATRPSPELREQVLRELKAARSRIEQWSLQGKARRSLQLGLRRAVKRARKALIAARAAHPPKEAAEHFHELRKRVKDLYYMACLLAPARPESLEPLAAKLDQLADLLGDDHDLAVLAEQAHALPDLFGGTMAVTLLLELSAARQQHLRQSAQPLAERLHELRPRSFARAVTQGLLQRRL